MSAFSPHPSTAPQPVPPPSLFHKFYLDIFPLFLSLSLSFTSIISGILSLDSRSNSFSSVWGCVLARKHWLVPFQSPYVQAAPASFRPYLRLLTVTLPCVKTLSQFQLLVSYWPIMLTREYLFLGLANSSHLYRCRPYLLIFQKS